MFENLFKLNKLKIYSYSDPERTKPFTGNNQIIKNPPANINVPGQQGGPAVSTPVSPYFEAMFNPESITQKFSIEYTEPQAIGSSGKQLTFSVRPPSSMRMTLIFAQSNFSSFAGNKISKLLQGKLDPMSLSSPIANTKTGTVSGWIRSFFEVTYDISSHEHQPLWLKVVWGSLSYTCRLGSVEINYTSFDRNGEPLGAELDVLFKGDVLQKDKLLDDNFMSPDVTHQRIVKAGDTLPLLSNAVYGDPSYYLIVAQANGLDDFRKLTPGQTLYFPPLT